MGGLAELPRCAACRRLPKRGLIMGLCGSCDMAATADLEAARRALLKNTPLEHLRPAVANIARFLRRLERADAHRDECGSDEGRSAEVSV